MMKNTGGKDHRRYLILVLSGVLSAARIYAQTPPHFEVASVKLNLDGMSAPSTRQINPGSITYKNRTLFDYVRLAYGVEGYQVTHGTSISLADRYDVVAKAASSVSVEQVKVMLQSLLEERLNLKIHREKREIPVYALVVAKNGPKFGLVLDDGESFVFRNSPMSALVSLLSGMPSLGRPVLDQTGLTGVYDFKLRRDSLSGQNTAGQNSKADVMSGMDDAVFSSLADLGLKLEPQKASVEFIVIDHFDRIPTDN